MAQQAEDRLSSLLEMQAADYFKLDPNQVHMFNKVKPSTKDKLRTNSFDIHRIPHVSHNQQLNHLHHKHRYHHHHHHHHHHLHGTSRINTLTTNKSFSVNEHRTDNKRKVCSDKNNLMIPNYSKTFRSKEDNGSNETNQTHLASSATYIIGSSTTSTNSLPSISSSPSVSPSLLCPHLSINDILMLKNDSKSAHTIGLCAKCRLDPPPNVHSPLSPIFNPASMSKVKSKDGERSKNEPKLTKPMKRGYSDHQVGLKNSNNRKNQLRKEYFRDDSLDYYVEPNELKRLQMSPTLRHSVEYIRNNTTEAGRVLKIYKNGEPYDKPLRICILHGEFPTLNHLLDYINGRQLIPSGARYLFHLDGQLVYSVNELKHGHTYVVSGTRIFDYQRNKIFKEQSMKDMLDNSHHHNSAQNLQIDTIQTKTTTKQSKPQFSTDTITSANRKKCNVSPIKDSKSLSTTKLEKSKSTPDEEPPKQLTSNLNNKKPMEVKKVKKSPDNPPLKSSKSDLNTKKPMQKSAIESNQNFKQSSSIKSSDRSTGQSFESLKSLKNDESSKEEKPVDFVRAKSELSALPKKRKKYVTFMDTGRGSSPAIVFNEQIKSDSEHSATIEASKETSELSISDKLDSRSNSEVGGDSNLQRALMTNEIGIQVSDSIDGFLIDLPIAMPMRGDEKKTFLKKGQGVRGRLNSRYSTQVKGKKTTNDSGATQASQKQRMVTLTERQLSLNELDEFKDLDHGDHSQGHHSEKHNEKDTVVEKESKRENSSDLRAKKERLGSENANTIVIGRTDKKTTTEQQSKEKKFGDWQYPGGRESSATPTERPVSQNEPNDIVRARVITPTPSTGDNQSLSLISYDMSGMNLMQRNDSRVSSNLSGSMQENLCQRDVVPVTGRLVGGTNPVSRNFRLAWVNGFAINDKFPENSNQQFLSAPSGTNVANAERALLSPTLMNPTLANKRTYFKPDERFNNWICHSKKYDELIYPAGSLIILWCRWTNEQRYYSNHTSNVSSLALASLDLDLAASAQVDDKNEKINASIHLWSLKTLNVLHIVEDDQFKSQIIFSLKVKNSQSEGCELCACSRDEKLLWLFVFNINLFEILDNNKKDVKKSVIKLKKNLQNNQQPLLVIKLSNVKALEEANTKSVLFNEDDVFISFGRRHFQLWLAERKKLKLRLMKTDNKNPQMTEAITKANCLLRMSPRDFLIGDNNGNIILLSVDCKQNSKVLSENPKYSIEIINLLSRESKDDDEDDSRAGASITCLARISGSLFVSGNSSCVLNFWRIESKASPEDGEKKRTICKQLSSINLPRDLGFLCAILIAGYNRKSSLVEFYAISTSNIILFGTVQLPQVHEKKTKENKERMLANSSLSVVYEGHESYVMNLVADVLEKGSKTTRASADNGRYYFTCSIDCKICKWDGKNLVWKSMLPSACISLAVHPIGSVLGIGSTDGTVYILNKMSGLLISYFPLTPVCINCLSYSADGTLLAAGCANGSIFILPVYEFGLKYKKVSIFQSPYPVVSLQFSMNNQFILTSITHGSYQELILWDLPNFRYMRDKVKLAADKIDWFDSICSGSEDVRAIWENANIATNDTNQMKDTKSPVKQRIALTKNRSELKNVIVNLSCHRLIRAPNEQQKGSDTEKLELENFVVASDTRGYLRLFRYPCYDIQQSFFEIKISSTPVNCCRFLALDSKSSDTDTSIAFVSSSLDGSICLWKLD